MQILTSNVYLFYTNSQGIKAMEKYNICPNFLFGTSLSFGPISTEILLFILDIKYITTQDVCVAVCA